jgi:hypothetical protein
MARPAESDEGGKAKSKFVMIVMSESMLPAACPPHFLDSVIEGVVGELLSTTIRNKAKGTYIAH